jgi:chromosome segregation ATPase
VETLRRPILDSAADAPQSRIAMAEVEAAVKALSSALDALEARLGERIDDLAHHEEAVDAARRHARGARAAAGEASDLIGAAISDLRALLARGPRLLEDKE